MEENGKHPTRLEREAVFYVVELGGKVMASSDIFIAGGNWVLNAIKKSLMDRYGHVQVAITPQAIEEILK